MKPRSTTNAPEAGADGSTVRLRILNHARRHFFAHGFRSVTMDDIAGELGLSKKTLYAHFASKTELLRATILAKFESIRQDFDQLALAGDADFPSRLQRLLECLQRHLQEPQPAFVRDMKREPEMFQWIQTLRRERVQKHFGRLFEECRSAGVIRKDVPTGVAIEILMGAIEAVINPQKLEELDLTPQAAFPMVVTVVLQGMLTEKGRSQT